MIAASTQSTTLRTATQQHQQATPCMCGTSVCTVLWLVDFFEACFLNVIDYLSFAAAVGGIAIMDENVRIVWIEDVCINESLYLWSSICASSPTRPSVDNSENADNTDNATTVSSSTSNSRQHHRHARVAYPYVVCCCCGYVLHTAVEQYTYCSKPMRWFVLEFR